MGGCGHSGGVESESGFYSLRVGVQYYGEKQLQWVDLDKKVLTAIDLENEPETFAAAVEERFLQQSKALVAYDLKTQAGTTVLDGETAYYQILGRGKRDSTMAGKIEVVRLGHPSLRVKSKTVHQSELKKPEVQKFLTRSSRHVSFMKAWDCGAASGGKSSGDCGEYRWRSAPKTFNRGISANDRVNPKVSHRSEATEEDWEGICRSIFGQWFLGQYPAWCADGIGMACPWNTSFPDFLPAYFSMR